MDNPLSAPQITEDHKKIVNRVKKHYQAGVSYKQGVEFFEKCAEYDRFWNADQWPAPTEETKNFPRPVTNMFAEIIDQKVAGVLHDVGEIHFLPVEQEVNPRRIAVEPFQGGNEGYDIGAAEALSLVAKHEIQRMEFRDLLGRGSLTSALMGTMVVLLYWDNNIVGGGENSKWIGNVMAQEIDPVDVYPEDPTQPDVQKQPGIIIAERLPLRQVKDFYGQFSEEVKYLKDTDPASHEHQTYTQQKHENEEAKYVNLYHYWTKEAIEKKFTVNDSEVTRIGFEVNYYVVCQDRVIRENKDISKAGLYPIASFQWLPKRKSFFGKAESADIIANQKEYNRTAGIGLLAAYTTGLPNIRYKEGFVDKRDIPAGGGGVIKDTSQPGTWAVDYMQPPQASGAIPYLKDSLARGVKDSSGVQEAWTGKAPSAQLNASAIIALQEAAGIRIGDIQQRVHRFLRDVGRILLAYWKEKWDYDRLIRITGDRHKTKVEGVFWFKGTDYEDMEFDVMVSSGPSPFSRAIMAATLEHMLQYQAIDGQEYLELLPPETFPRVQHILERRREREEEARQMMLEQQFVIIESVAEQVVAQAQMQGVEITPEAIQQLMEMVQEASKEMEGDK